MTFNEFNRRLESCHLDDDTKYLLSHMFEVQMEFSKHLDLTLGIAESLADKMQRSLENGKEIMERVKALQKYPGVEVHSVRREPDDA